MSASDFVIETRGLTKRYGSAEALAGLDLRVPAGSIYGFLGRNGAGKTTTVKTLMGMVRPSAGEGRVLGHPIGDERASVEIRRRTAHVGEDRSAWPGMSPAGEPVRFSNRTSSTTQDSSTPMRRRNMRPNESYARRLAGCQ